MSTEPDARYDEHGFCRVCGSLVSHADWAREAHDRFHAWLWGVENSATYEDRLRDDI